MRENLKRAFLKASYQPEAGLADDLWQTIEKRKNRSAHFKLTILSITGGASISGLASTLKILSGDLAQSGFYEYFSLIFSDSRLMLAYWKELAFSLAESLPIMSMIISLSLIFILFLSLKHLMKQI